MPADNPLFLLIDQVRHGEVTVSDHELTLDSPRLHKQGITVQGSPLPEEPGAVLLVLQDASAARALDRQLAFRGAARSVTGMAAMLAHEVKNPLSGIRGAAQLLEASVGDERPRAGRADPRRGRPHPRPGRPHGGVRREADRAQRREHPRVLEHVRKLAQTGFAAHVRFHEDYDPSLPPVWGNRDQLIQVFLNLVKNAAEAVTDAGQPNPEIVLIDRLSSTACAWRCRASTERRRPAAGGRGARQRAGHPGGHPPASVRSLRHRRRPPAAGLAWRWSPRWSATMAA